MADKPLPADDQPALPDDVWEKFVSDSEAEIRATAPKEPSARARMVTERLRQSDAAAAAGTGRKGLKGLKLIGGRKTAVAPPAEPPGWRTGPAWQEMHGRAQRRRRLLGLLGVLAAAGLTLAVLNPTAVRDWVRGRSDGSGHAAGSSPQVQPATPVTLPPETARPSAAPSDPMPDIPTLQQPFLGSPAVQYADGAAGIVLPAAKPVGDMSAEQVEFALQKTKELLVDADLDPKTLRGERPRAALDLLDPMEKDFLGELNTDLAKPGKDHDPLMLFSRYNPAELRLAGDIVKTRGRMTFKEGEDGSVLVDADYSFVYPFVKAAAGSTQVSRTIVRRVLETEVAGSGRMTDGKLWIVHYNEDIANSACGIYDGYLHPYFSGEARLGDTPTGPATDPYDRSKDVKGGSKQDENVCGRVSRT